MTQAKHQAGTETATGVLCGASAFLFWGAAAAYWKLLGDQPPLELLAHRVSWALLLMAGIATLGGHWAGFRAIFADRRTLRIMLTSAALVGLNWFIFIYAIISDRVLQASLGYYINPLINVLFGFLFLGERLRPLQKLAVAVAAAGVAYLTIRGGAFPWLALLLALSFGFYGLLRKLAPIGAVSGLTFETLVLAGPAVAFLTYLGAAGAGSFGRQGVGTDLLLIASGAVTAIPLALFAMAVRRIHLSTVGILQYIAPSCMFLLGVFAYGEPFSASRQIAFFCIWAALALYTGESLYRARRLGRERRRALEAAPFQTGPAKCAEE